jgi:hypothetical protein
MSGGADQDIVMQFRAPTCYGRPESLPASRHCSDRGRTGCADFTIVMHAC